MTRCARGVALKRSPYNIRARTTIAEGILCVRGAFDVKHFSLFEDCEFGGGGNGEAFGDDDFGGGVVLRSALAGAGEGRGWRGESCDGSRKDDFSRKDGIDWGQDEIDGEDGGIFQ